MHSEARSPSSSAFFGCVFRFLGAMGAFSAWIFAVRDFCGAPLAGVMVALAAMLGSLLGRRLSLNVEKSWGDEEKCVVRMYYSGGRINGVRWVQKWMSWRKRLGGRPSSLVARQRMCCTRSNGRENRSEQLTAVGRERGEGSARCISAISSHWEAQWQRDGRQRQGGVSAGGGRVAD